MTKVLFFLVLAFSIFLLPSMTSSLELGAPAPPFVVESADGKTFHLNMTLGYLTLIFYEDRKAVEKNESIKFDISTLRDNNRFILHNLQIIQVINASSANFLTRRIWKRKLLQNSIKNNIVIYADWSGNMLRDFQLQSGESNLIFIDPKGITRYIFAGQINDLEKKVLEELVISIGKEYSELNNEYK